MQQVRGTHEMECFISDEALEESNLAFLDDVTETFKVQVGPVEYYRNHLQDLADRMNAEYGYYFEVGKLADALYHLRKIDGFLTDDVLIADGDVAGYEIAIEYRTDQMYPLRVRISENGWYVLAPVHDEEDRDE